MNTPITRAYDQGPIAYRMLAALVSFVLRPLVHIDTRRLDVASKHRTAVVVTNHRSFFDVAVGLVAFHRIRRYPRVVVASEWFERRSTGWALRAAGALPIDRSDPAAYYEHARRVLDAGHPILLLPEGKLLSGPTDRTSVGTFKTGAARLALHCGTDVWPLAIVGSEDIWPSGKRMPRLNPFRKRTVFLLGADTLLSLEGDARASTEQIREAVVQLLHEAVELSSDVFAD
jgi:1-acyl-sn-glycerol-3-phosphate acyltransferase